MRIARWVALGLAASVPLALGVSGTAGADDGSNGGAFGVQVSVLGGTVTVPPTPLVLTPPGGQRSVVNVGAGGVNVSALSVSSGQAADGTVSSSAGVLGATVPGFLTATALTSACSAGPAGTSGTAGLVNASTPLGVVPVNPPPNTTVPVVVGTLTLNEQQTGPNSIRVRAAHAAASPVADVVLAESACGASLVGAANAVAAAPTRGRAAATPALAG